MSSSTCIICGSVPLLHEQNWDSVMTEGPVSIPAILDVWDTCMEWQILSNSDRIKDCSQFLRFHSQGRELISGCFLKEA